MQQLLDRFGAHLRLETLIAVRFDRFSVFSLGQYLFIGKGGRARIDYDVCRKIKNLLKRARRHIQNQTHSARDSPEKPDM